MTGPETISHYKASGCWWNVEEQCEVRRTRSDGGVLKVERTALKPVCLPHEMSVRPDVVNASEDLSLQLKPRKTRDETVSRACGHIKDLGPVPMGAAERPYIPLHVLSGYSFGRSVLLAEEIPRLAARCGMPAIAQVDSMNLSGAAEHVKQCRLNGIKPLVGTSVEMVDGGELVLIVKNKAGWRSLSRLVSACHLEEPRLFPLCTWERLERHSEGLLCLTGGDLGPLDRLLSRRQLGDAQALVDCLVRLFGHDSVFLEVDRAYLPWSIRVERLLRELSAQTGLPLVAGGAVTHRRRSHFPAQDVLVCADTLCTVDEVIGRKPLRHESQPNLRPFPTRALNAERFLKTPSEMADLFADAPELLDATHEVANLCDPDILPGMTQLPIVAEDPDAALFEAVMTGAREWHRRVTPELRNRLTMELSRFAELGYSSHVLVAWDMCRWARHEGILFSGRGSAVDSAALYALGISRIDAHHHNLHFERFMPADGTKKPDIDIDFEAARRDDVHAYLISKYGKDHVAGIAAIGSFRTRGILRETGKALGLTDEAISAIAKRLHGGVQPEALCDAMEKRPELKGIAHAKTRLQWVFKLAEVLRDTPRNIRAHSSGVVISREPIIDVVPVQSSEGAALNRILQWDKRSAKRCFIKFDILCLRGQDVLSGTQSRLREVDPEFEVDKVDPEQPEIYRAMRSCQTVGIPQSASPAMTQAHARIQTQNLTDASLVQAGIRPGVGGAVKLNTLIKRRHGEPYSFEHPDFERILGHTYGIIVFQEQVDQLLETFCGFTPGQSEEIREGVHEKRNSNYGASIREVLIERMQSRGYTLEVSEAAYEYISGFKGYGFAQGHALAFAEVSARSVWCQQNYPAPYFAALLDAQPAGYYGPATLVNEARIRGLSVLPPDVNVSTLRVEVEDIVAANDPKVIVPAGGIRLDLRWISGLSKSTAERIVARQPYFSLTDFIGKSKPARDELEQVILAGALDSIHPNRKALLWAAEEAYKEAFARTHRGGLALGFTDPTMPDVDDFSFAEKAIQERHVMGLDVSRHLVSFERDRIRSKDGLTTAAARSLGDGAKAFVVGNPIRLRFPPTPTGRRVVFFDLEDETGLLNVTCFDDVYQRDGEAIVLSPYVTVIGKSQVRDGYPAFLAERVLPYTPKLLSLAEVEAIPLKTADFLVG